jgi:hypothetical protein
MKRRTPHEKVAAFAQRIMEDAKRCGTVPGLSDEKMSEIMGEAWKTGRAAVTAEAVQRVAQHYMGVGEKENKAADDKRVVRAHPLA